MVETVRYAREQKVPYLGLCLGLQVMVIDWARHILGLEGANSEELEPGTEHPVVHIMPEQEGVTIKGGTMRLGSYPCRPQADTMTREAYGSGEVMERHRHRLRAEQRLPRSPGAVRSHLRRSLSRRQAGGGRGGEGATRSWWGCSTTPSSGRAPTAPIPSSSGSSPKPPRPSAKAASHPCLLSSLTEKFPLPEGEG